MTDVNYRGTLVKVKGRGLLLVLAVFILTCVSVMPIVFASSPEDTENWSMFGHDSARQSHSLSSAPNDNNVKWFYNTTTEILTSPAIADGYVVVTCINGEIIGFNATSGKKLWTNFLEGISVQGWSCPAIDSGRVFFGANNKNLYCLKLSTGDLLWTFAAGDEIDSSPLVEDGRVFFSSWEGKFYCLDSVNGSVVWEHVFSSSRGSSRSSPAMSEGIIVFGSVTNVYALNQSTGNEIWTYPAGAHVASAPAINEEKVYFGMDCYRYVLERDNWIQI